MDTLHSIGALVDEVFRERRVAVGVCVVQRCVAAVILPQTALAIDLNNSNNDN